jgi:D-xylose 1-dehydrogenase (NADP+, D-xylono-1,5-lactone-forming)
MEKVRFGVLGTAKIAIKVGQAIKDAASAELASIGSRNIETAKAWGIQHGAPRAFGSYQEVLSDQNIDAVYIPLPPSLHCEWTVKAAEAGKHVLCEKPTALNSREVATMFAACKANGVQFMDGTMWSHHPRTAEMKAVLKSGKLGRLRRITSAFTVNIADTPGQIRFNPALGGGAIYDLGWYCVRAALWAFDELPQRVYATGEYHQGVDINAAVMMWFSNQRTAAFDCGFDMGLRKWFEVAGEEGSLVCDDFPAPTNIDAPRFWTHDEIGNSDTHLSVGVVQQTEMVQRFCEIACAGTLEERWFNESLDTQRVVDALLKSLQLKKEVEVENA